MTRTDDIKKEMLVIQRKMDEARELDKDPAELIAKLWHLTDELVSIREKEDSDKRKKSSISDIFYYE